MEQGAGEIPVDRPWTQPTAETTAFAGPGEGAPVPVDSVERQLQSVLREMNDLRGELNMLRRRDETINFYMHRLDEELRLAARLQQDFLPKELPQAARLQIHTLFRPAGYVSGDLYDVTRLDERRIGFYMADAVGHGVPAALLTMFIKQSLQTHEPAIGGGLRALPPSRALARLNESLLRQALSQATFATAVYGMIDVETLELTLAKAGHPSPVILHADGTVETVEADGGLLGVFPEETYADTTVRLRPGDRLFLYTDGIEVAFGEGHADPHRWREELRGRRHLSSVQLLSEFSDQLDLENGSLAPKDDLTMILIEVQD